MSFTKRVLQNSGPTSHPVLRNVGHRVLPTYPALEVYPESELHHARIARERGDLCCGAGTYVAARRSKQRVIEHVKHLPAKLRPQVFRDRKVLDQGSIEDIGCWRIERVASPVSHHSIAGIGKGIAQA
jgi:hypothetical protein